MKQITKDTTTFLDVYHDQVVEMFHHRCVRCNKYSEIVHEIIPRSRLPKTWMLPENRIVLCFECHFWAHHHGASSSASELHQLRMKALEKYG